MLRCPRRLHLTHRIHEIRVHPPQLDHRFVLAGLLLHDPGRGAVCRLNDDQSNQADQEQQASNDEEETGN